MIIFYPLITFRSPPSPATEKEMSGLPANPLLFSVFALPSTKFIWMSIISTIYNKFYHYTYTLRRKLASIYRDIVFYQLYLDEKPLYHVPGPDSYREAKTSPTATPTATKLYHRAVSIQARCDTKSLYITVNQCIMTTFYNSS